MDNRCTTTNDGEGYTQRKWSQSWFCSSWKFGYKSCPRSYYWCIDIAKSSNRILSATWWANVLLNDGLKRVTGWKQRREWGRCIAFGPCIVCVTCCTFLPWCWRHKHLLHVDMQLLCAPPSNPFFDTPCRSICAAGTPHTSSARPASCSTRKILPQGLT